MIMLRMVIKRMRKRRRRLLPDRKLSMKGKLGRGFITVYNIQCFRIQRVVYWTWQPMRYWKMKVNGKPNPHNHTQSSVIELIDAQINFSCKSTYRGSKYGHLTKLADSWGGFMCCCALCGYSSTEKKDTSVRALLWVQNQIILKATGTHVSKNNFREEIECEKEEWLSAALSCHQHCLLRSQWWIIASGTQAQGPSSHYLGSKPRW